MPKRARSAWAEQRRSARYRGIAFKMNLWEFWGIWNASGKWSQRGRGADKFCMSRINDSGAYQVGNVRIITNADNIRLYQLASPSAHKRRSPEKQGVLYAYPGYSKPYIATYAGRVLGFFITEREAYEARHAHMAKLAA